MNPWWRRPTAEDGPARAEPKRRSVPDAAVQEEAGGQMEEPAGEPEVQPAAGEVEASAAEETAPETDVADGEDAGEASVSAALEAATEPAQPARATPSDEDEPAPARRRRRRRRGGRGRGRAAQADGESSAEEETPAAPDRQPAASLPLAGRAAVLLDLGALKRSLGATSGLDPESLFARLDEDLGKLVLRRVYADAGDRDLDRAALHRGSIEVVDVPSNMEERGCSAAVRIVVDAIELCYTKRGVNTMVLVASSVQMLPLVAKLQQNSVTVIGLGGADADAQVRGQCDRFIELSV